MSTTLALDIGGTKIAYGLVDDDRPAHVYDAGCIPSQPPGGSIAEQIKSALLCKTLPTRVAIAAPGIIDPIQGKVMHSGPTVPGWQGTDLISLVRSVIDVPVYCHNDVRVWAFGEHMLGSGRDYSGRVLYLALGTGVGGAIVDKHMLIDGPTGSAGEISELITADFRGLADRAENIASGPSLARYYEYLCKEMGPPTDKIEWSDPQGVTISLKDVLEKMADGDELAARIINGNLEGFGRTIGALATAFDLSCIVLGGGVVGIGEMITDPLRRGIMHGALAPNREIPVLVSKFGGDAALVAAAAYAREKEKVSHNYG